MTINYKPIQGGGGLHLFSGSNVPCNGCTACCKNEIVVLCPENGDKVEDYLHHTIELEGGAKLEALDQRENGDCIYLGEAGCTIYGRAPFVCKTFDCRTYFLSMSRDERRWHVRVNPHKKNIFTEGRKRLASVSEKERAEAAALRVGMTALEELVNTQAKKK